MNRKTGRGAFWEKVAQVESGCWEWTGTNRGFGYGHIRTSKTHTEQAHRVAWMLAYGEIPEGRYVLHRCDNRRCVRADHLFLGTYADNVADMMAKGRHWRQRGAA